MQLSHMYLSKALENVMKFEGNVTYLVPFTPLVSIVIQQITSYKGCTEKWSIYDEFLLEDDREYVFASSFKIVKNCDFCHTKLIKVCTSCILT